MTNKTQNAQEINRKAIETMEPRGDVEIYTVPIEGDGCWTIFQGRKYIFLSDKLTPDERESRIEAGLEGLELRANG